jgi:hypothetical protein
MTSPRYFAVMGIMPSGQDFCYGASSTKAAALAMKRHAEQYDNRFYATFKVEEFPREKLGAVLGLV